MCHSIKIVTRQYRGGWLSHCKWVDSFTRGVLILDILKGFRVKSDAVNLTDESVVRVKFLVIIQIVI